MIVEQISVFLENKTGRLSEVTLVLAEAGVNIRALSVADTSDFGVLRLIVDDNAKAEKALKNNGFTVGKTNVVAAEVKDEPGGLNAILSLLNKADINVEYMYAFVQKSGDNAVMIFRFDHIDGAIKLLKENGINMVESSKIYTL